MVLTKPQKNTYHFIYLTDPKSKSYLSKTFIAYRSDGILTGSRRRVSEYHSNRTCILRYSMELKEASKINTIHRKYTLLFR